MRPRIQRHSRYYLYILQCIDGTYYTGSTNNLEQRLKLHNNGNGAKYLRGKLPVRLVYVKEYRYYKRALQAEHALKKLTRKEKEELVKIYARNHLMRHGQSEALGATPLDLSLRSGAPNLSRGVTAVGLQDGHDE